MGVFVGVPVLVFMCAFHINTPFLDVNVG